MGLIDHNQLVACGQLRELLMGHAKGDDPGPEIPTLVILLPHGQQILRTDNHRAQVKIIAKDPNEGTRHHRLPQANDITEQHATALIEMARSNFHGGLLEGEELTLEVSGQ